MMRKLALAAGLALFLPVSDASAAPFTNGSFELGPNVGSFVTLYAPSNAITGWEVFAGSVDYIGSYWTAAQGSRSLDMDGLSPGGIRQTFDTLAGTTYLVNFALAGNDDGAPATKEVRVTSGAFSNLFQFVAPAGTNNGNMNWAYQSFLFTAAAGSSTLEFLSTSNVNRPYYGAALDDVTVTAVPEPGMLALLGLGAALTVARRRR